MSSEIMASVIMPAYNCEKYIDTAIESVLMQKTAFRYELLIGDDASTDKTCRIIEEYKKKYPDIIHAWHREINCGATKNAYLLFCQAKGKYIATCEGDDYWIDVYKLQKQISFLENRQEFIGCSHDCLVIDAKGEKTRNQNLSWVSKKTVFSLDDFNGMLLPGQSGTIVRRNIYINSKDKYDIFYKAHRQIGDRTTALISEIEETISHIRPLYAIHSCINQVKLP